MHKGTASRRKTLNNSRRNVNNSESNFTNSSIDFRREKVLEYTSKGFGQREISVKLMCSQSTISRDLTYLKMCSRENIKNYIDSLTFEYELVLISLTNVIKEAWKDVENPENKHRHQALALVMNACSEKIDALSAIPIIDRAIEYFDKKREQTPASTNENEQVRI